MGFYLLHVIDKIRWGVPNVTGLVRRSCSELFFCSRWCSKTRECDTPFEDTVVCSSSVWVRRFLLKSFGWIFLMFDDTPYKSAQLRSSFSLLLVVTGFENDTSRNRCSKGYLHQETAALYEHHFIRNCYIKKKTCYENCYIAEMVFRSVTAPLIFGTGNICGGVPDVTG